MTKKIFFIILIIAVVVFAARYFQPIKGSVTASSVNYKLAANWPNLPAGYKLGNPTGLAIDASEHLVVFHRAERVWPVSGVMPNDPIQAKTILVIDCKTGELISNWGDNLFIMPHGLTVDHENNIWVTDVALHQIFKFSYEGKLILKLGEAKVAGKDSSHFDMPTDVAVAKDGSFYVSDGYGNSRVIKFSSAGKYLFEWGRSGEKKGEFNIPHAISLDNNSNVYVADRENNRIQIFDSSGRFIKQWSDKSFGTITSVMFEPSNRTVYAVDDLKFMNVEHRGSDVFIFDTTGKVQKRFGRSGSYDGPLVWYHDITVDRKGNIYIGDIIGNKIQKFVKTLKQ